jgi:hypothetical protein
MTQHSNTSNGLAVIPSQPALSSPRFVLPSYYSERHM